MVIQISVLVELFSNRSCNLGRRTKLNHTVVMAFRIGAAHKPLIVNSGGGLSVEIFHLGIKLHAALEIDIGHFISKLVLGIVAVPCALLGIACNAVADFLVRNATVIDQTDSDVVMLDNGLMSSFDNPSNKRFTGMYP